MIFKFLYFVNLILYKTKKASHKKYSLKLEDCYFDYKINEYTIVLRFRNKNAVIKKTIEEIVKKNLINNLHPYDAYMIGAIKIMQDNNFILKNFFVKRDFDHYFVIDPCMDFVGVDFAENKLVFKLRSNSSEIKVPMEHASKNAKFIQSMDAVNAFLIGSMVASISIQCEF